MTHPHPATPPGAPRRLRRLLGRFLRAEHGATAVEFGMLALPFFFLVFAIIEIAMVMWTSQVLETAVSTAARKIYTGEFQNDPGNGNKTSAQMLASFKTSLCSQVTGLFNCTADVAVDVRSVSSFAGAVPPSPVVNGSYDASGYGYQSVGPKEIALVTASLQYKSLMPFATTNSSLSNGNRLVMATAAFRTEPYTN